MCMDVYQFQPPVISQAWFQETVNLHWMSQLPSRTLTAQT